MNCPFKNDSLFSLWLLSTIIRSFIWLLLLCTTQERTSHLCSSICTGYQLAARIKFKALMFAYKTTSGSAPLYLNSVLQTYVPSSLRSASEWRISVPSQRGTKSLSQTFSLTVPTWWNDPAQLNLSSWILSHLQETAKKHISSIFIWPLTLTLSILILFYLSRLVIALACVALCWFWLLLLSSFVSRFG